MSKVMNARNVKVAESKAKNFIKPGKRLNFIVSAEDTQALADVVTGAVQNESAIALDLHIGDKEGNEGGTFKAGFFFVRDLSQQEESTSQRPKKRYVSRRNDDTAKEAAAAKTVTQKVYEDDIDF